MGHAGAKLYGRMVKTDEEALAHLPEDVRRNVPGNGLRLVVAHALQKAGDQVVNASTVLAWFVASLGGPSWTIGLLVPVRESGSMLPQAALAPWVRRHRQRKRIWIIGAAGQAAAVAAMAFTAAVGTGTAAGVAILFEMAAFALARALASIASKDVQGRTIPPGQRGQINGIAAFASGIVAVTIGLRIRLIGGDVDPAALAALLGCATLAWLVALLVFAHVKEPDALPAENNDDVVDMATGDQRTQYVAVSNTARGVLLLVTGGISSALAQLGTGVALLFLAAMGSAGVIAARSLPEVSTGKRKG